jgi:hypothetical protein
MKIAKLKNSISVIKASFTILKRSVCGENILFESNPVKKYFLTELNFQGDFVNVATHVVIHSSLEITFLQLLIFLRIFHNILIDIRIYWLLIISARNKKRKFTERTLHGTP